MRRALVAALVPALLLSGCLGTDEEGGRSPAPAMEEGAGNGTARLTVRSASFQEGGAIPRDFTCDGAGKSPALNITGAPANATALALIAGDPDAPLPQAPQRNFTHWLAWNVPLANGSATFPEGAPPAGAVEGKNDGGGTGYTGPCPPFGSPAHRYFFTVYALDAPLDLGAGATRADVEQALQGRVLAQGALMGAYARALPVGS